jgi:hypothetical protein
MQQTPDRHVRGLSGLPGSGYLLQVPRVLCNLVSNKKEQKRTLMMKQQKVIE